MDDDVRRYIEQIEPANRPLFDRVHRLIRQACPDATLTMSYQIPTFAVGKRRLYVGAWKHGVSLYGWQADRDGGFSARHPELRSGKATLRLHRDSAGDIDDAELIELARHALSA